MKRKPFYRQLYFWVLVGMALGIIVGWRFPEKGAKAGDFTGTELKPLADGFIRLIRMVIAPIIFTTVVTGMAGMNSLKRVGRIGLKAILYFEVMTTLALLIGWVAVKVFQPGQGMNIDPGQLDISDLQPTLSAASSHHPGAIQFILNIIPRSIVGAFAEGEILQVLFVSVLFGIAMGGLGEANRPIINAISQVSKALMRMIAMIIKLAPVAVFGAMSFTISKTGTSSLRWLGMLLLCVYSACIFFVVFGLGALLRLNGLSLWKFIRYLRHELFLVFSTGSSESAFPRMIVRLENLGCSKALVGLVLPAGYSFNLDGSSIYLSMAALFIGQATNMHLSLGQEFSLLAVCLLTSKGAAAVAGSGFITLAATLASMHTIPVEGMVLILGVDWFMAQARALTNLMGNGVATVVLARWEQEFDAQKAARVLDEPVSEPDEKMADLGVAPTTPEA